MEKPLSQNLKRKKEKKGEKTIIVKDLKEENPSNTRYPLVF